MVTDPPYGVGYDPAWRGRAGVNANTGKMGKVANDERADWREAWALFSGEVAYVWHASRFANVVQDSLEACGFAIRAQIVWGKDRFALSRGHYHWQHEPCWYAVREGKSAHWRGDRKQSTVWEVANLNPFGGETAGNDEATGHGTQKPVELMRRPILNHCEAGEVVYDPFLGSGSTLIAAEATQRICYGVEIDPAYVDLIVTRWQKLAGETAVLDGDGRTFSELESERRNDAAGSAVSEPLETVDVVHAV